MSKHNPTRPLQTQAPTLSGLEYEDQAVRFFAWFVRLPSPSTITEAFKQWADGKDFEFQDRVAIGKYVYQLLQTALDGPFNSRVSLALDQLLEADSHGFES